SFLPVEAPVRALLRRARVVEVLAGLVVDALRRDEIPLVGGDLADAGGEVAREAVVVGEVNEDVAARVAGRRLADAERLAAITLLGRDVDVDDVRVRDEDRGVAAARDDHLVETDDGRQDLLGEEACALFVGSAARGRVLIPRGRVGAACRDDAGELHSRTPQTRRFMRSRSRSASRRSAGVIVLRMTWPVTRSVST